MGRWGEGRWKRQYLPPVPGPNPTGRARVASAGSLIDQVTGRILLQWNNPLGSGELFCIQMIVSLCNRNTFGRMANNKEQLPNPSQPDPVVRCYICWVPVYSHITSTHSFALLCDLLPPPQIQLPLPSPLLAWHLLRNPVVVDLFIKFDRHTYWYLFSVIRLLGPCRTDGGSVFCLRIPVDHRFVCAAWPGQRTQCFNKGFK